MSRTCTACGASVTPEDRFCGECGQSLPAARADLRGDAEKAGSPPPAERSRTLAIAGLIVAGVLVLGVGAYQVIQKNFMPPPPSTSTRTGPAPAAAPEPKVATPPPAPAPEAAPERTEVARTPPPQPKPDCGNLVPPGKKLVCADIEPFWAIEFSCGQSGLTSNYRAFAGSDIASTPGTVSLASRNPWVFRTSQGVAGSVASTPGGCHTDADELLDFTLTPTAVPVLESPMGWVCCSIR